MQLKKRLIGIFSTLNIGHHLLVTERELLTGAVPHRSFLVTWIMYAWHLVKTLFFLFLKNEIGYEHFRPISSSDNKKILLTTIMQQNTISGLFLHVQNKLDLP